MWSSCCAAGRRPSEAAIIEIQSILSLPSGYQRDLQLTKAPLIRGLGAALQALAIVPALVAGMPFRPEKMEAAISTDMFATDLALEQAAAGSAVSRSLSRSQAEAGGKVEARRRSQPGSTRLARRLWDLQLDQIRQRLEQEKGS